VVPSAFLVPLEEPRLDAALPHVAQTWGQIRPALQRLSVRRPRRFSERSLRHRSFYTEWGR